jgi:Leucine-rich repeat (LRR) protein
VEKINIAHNQIKEVNLEKGGFDCLQDLNMSFNYLGYGYVPQLALIPCLMHLDLSYNELAELPESLEHFQLLKKINLEGNQFRSDHKAANFWGALATLPRIEIISVARNKIRGIHT